MALTAEQQEQLDFQKAQNAYFQKTEFIRLAKDVLLEADRNKPVDERGVTAEDIIAFATTLNNYANQ
jgi:hypothetical protein